MSQRQQKALPKLSIMDRLTLDESWEENRSAERANRQLRDCVRRDLEILFNTRPRYLSWPASLAELQTSNLSFGMPDLQTRQIASANQREEFRVLMEGIIRRFEPRLKNVTVEILSGAGDLDRSLRFRIHAVLMTDADSEAIVYDTLLDPASRMLSFAADGREPI